MIDSTHVRTLTIALLLLITVFVACTTESDRIKQKQMIAARDSVLAERRIADSLATLEKLEEIKKLAEEYFEYTYDDFRKSGQYRLRTDFRKGSHYSVDKRGNRSRDYALVFEAVIQDEGYVYFGARYHLYGNLRAKRAAAMIGDRVIWSSDIPIYDPRNETRIGDYGYSGGVIWFTNWSDNGMFEAMANAGNVQIKFRLEDDKHYYDLDVEPEIISQVRLAIRLSNLLKAVQRLR